MNSKSVSKILNILVILAIVITSSLILMTPFIVAAFFKSQFSLLDNKLVIKVTIFIYLSAIPYLIALVKLKKLSSLIVNNNPFSIESVKSLKMISICSFSEIIIFATYINYLKQTTDFFSYIVLGGPIILVTFICVTIGFLCLVLSQLFEIAIEIKEENDKTI
ncbi:MAG: DUF2975 domain-containing protein [Acidaminobacteraceae bacterium]